MVFFFNSCLFINSHGLISYRKAVVDLLDKVKIKKIKIPKLVSALITVILLWILVFTFFRIFIPLIANQANELSRIDTGEIYRLLDKPINWLRNIYNNYDLGGEEMSDFDEFINTKIKSVLNISFITNFFHPYSEHLATFLWPFLPSLLYCFSF